MQPYRHDNRISFCAALMALALLVQIVRASGVEAATAGLIAAAPPPAETAESVAPVDSSPPEDPMPSSDPEPDREPDADSPPAAFTAAEGEAIPIGGASTYQVDPVALLQQPLALPGGGDGPQVLIIHTHTSESYTPEPDYAYENTNNYHTEDNRYNVVRVGQELADTLEQCGISVLHDETSHDAPSYNGAYARTLTNIEQDLADNPSIRLVLDLHRDAIADEDGTLLGTAQTLGGVDTARVMLVVGTDEGGLPHPNWRDNLSCALKLRTLLEREQPGVSRMIDLRTERFNQHTSPGALLLEIGSAGDTLTEALAAARLVGQAVASLLALA